MAEVRVTYDDGPAYERFMGRWSRAVGGAFLDWLEPKRGAAWLDVGCGTGVFTELIIERAAPSSLVGVDPAPAQIAYAVTRPVGRLAAFQVGDARKLPFPPASFDMVVSALALNFIPDRAKALVEMRRVGRPGGTVAAYVWDFAGQRSTTWPFTSGLRALGFPDLQVPGAESTRLEALQAEFETAGLADVAVRGIEGEVMFPTFAEFWSTQAPAFTPTGKSIAALSPEDRERLHETVRRLLGAPQNGPFTYGVWAHAVKGDIPA